MSMSRNDKEIGNELEMKAEKQRIWKEQENKQTKERSWLRLN